jgi:hypothetical protein
VIVYTGTIATCGRKQYHLPTQTPSNSDYPPKGSFVISPTPPKHPHFPPHACQICADCTCKYSHQPIIIALVHHTKWSLARIPVVYATCYLKHAHVNIWPHPPVATSTPYPHVAKPYPRNLTSDHTSLNHTHILDHTHLYCIVKSSHASFAV